MSKVFNMVGGSGKNISSIVITGRKSTDTVTCTKDGKSYTAAWNSTAQRWEIVGLPLGTFTVTATNGTKTVTETVLIDIAGVYEIEMSYKFWLYRDGYECEDVTGGWTNNGYSFQSRSINPATKNADSFYFCPQKTNNYTVGFGTANKIDITRFSTLAFTCMRTIGGYQPSLICDTTKTMTTGSPIYAPLDSNYTTNTLYTLKNDISSLSGEYYIALESNAGAPAEHRESYVYKVWLE